MTASHVAVVEAGSFKQCLTKCACTTQLLSACNRSDTFRKFWTDLPYHTCVFNSGCTHSVSQVFQEASDLLHKLCIFVSLHTQKICSVPHVHNNLPHTVGLTWCFQGVELAAQVLHSIYVSISIWTYYRNPRRLCLTFSWNSCNHKQLLWQNTGCWIVTVWSEPEMREGRNTSRQLCCQWKCFWYSAFMCVYRRVTWSMHINTTYPIRLGDLIMSRQSMQRMCTGSDD